MHLYISLSSKVGWHEDSEESIYLCLRMKENEIYFDLNEDLR